MVVAFAPGNYRFLAAPGQPFSAGIAADPGFDLTRACWAQPRPLDEGFRLMREHLAAAGRPLTAVAALELRLPEPRTPEGFADFNRGYVDRLRAMGLAAEAGMPAARTNVAPLGGRVTEPCLYAFTYTLPGGADRHAFRISGSGETGGDTPEARIRSILDVLERRMDELGVQPQSATLTHLYAAGALSEALQAELLRRLPALHGVRWFPALPPLNHLRFEIDTGCVGAELLL